MKHLIRFPLESGHSVIMEVEEPDNGITRAARPHEVMATANQTLESALEHIKPAAEAVLAKLSSLSERPEEVEVEFGLKASAEAGMIIASGKLDANYTVKVKWVRKQSRNSENSS